MTTKKKTTRQKGRNRKPSGNQATVLAREVWYAGLGALSVASERSNEMWRRVAETRHNAEDWVSDLVNRGQKVDKKVRPVEQFRGRVDEVRDRVEEMRDEVDDRGRTLRKNLRGVFEDGMERTLSMLNIPTREQVDALRRELARLERKVDKLPARRTRTTAKKKTKKKNIAA